MYKWRIYQTIINLPREKQIPAILLFFILVSLSSNTAVALYFISNIKDLKAEKKAGDLSHQKENKTKDSLINVIQDKRFDFAVKQLDIANSHKREIDSLRIVKSIKK